VTWSPPQRGGRQRSVIYAAGVSGGLGLGSAVVSAYWACGGTALLDTVGGEIERWGLQPDPVVVLALWAIVVLKAGVAVAAPVLAARQGQLPAWTRGRAPRLLSWAAALVLTVYGGVLTLVGLLVQTGAIRSQGGDHLALAWHAFVWDPWFLVWGIAFLCVLHLTRSDEQKQRRVG
jgi:hypothetical protein